MIKKHLTTLKKYILFRYLVSGGTSAVFDLSSLYVLNAVCGVQYLISAVVAFLIAFGVSFTLHKFWTFKTHIVHDTRKQIGLYLATSLVGLSLNTLLMYVLVGHFGLDVLLAQIFAGMLVACCTFFLSRNIVFKWNLNVPL